MDAVLLRAAAAVAIVLVAVAVGLLWRRRSGRIRSGDGRFDRSELASVGLGASNADVRALLLSSPTCAPCRSVRDVLREVEGARSDFAWVSVDAADHLPLTRQHHVLRVPTLFVIDRDGRIVARTSGVPATREILEVVEEVSRG